MCPSTLFKKENSLPTGISNGFLIVLLLATVLKSPSVSSPLEYNGCVVSHWQPGACGTLVMVKEISNFLTLFLLFLFVSVSDRDQHAAGQTAVVGSEAGGI